MPTETCRKLLAPPQRCAVGVGGHGRQEEEEEDCRAQTELSIRFLLPFVALALLCSALLSPLLPVYGFARMEPPIEYSGSQSVGRGPPQPH